MCVCVCERERERERPLKLIQDFPLQTLRWTPFGEQGSITCPFIVILEQQMIKKERRPLWERDLCVCTWKKEANLGTRKIKERERNKCQREREELVERE